LVGIVVQHYSALDYGFYSAVSVVEGVSLSFIPQFFTLLLQAPVSRTIFSFIEEIPITPLSTTLLKSIEVVRSQQPLKLQDIIQSQVSLRDRVLLFPSHRAIQE
jgi:hypothetical protein